MMPICVLVFEWQVTEHYIIEVPSAIC